MILVQGRTYYYQPIVLAPLIHYIFMWITLFLGVENSARTENESVATKVIHRTKPEFLPKLKRSELKYFYSVRFNLFKTEVIKNL